MANKIDLSDPYKDLDDLEKEFVYTLTDNISLSDAEMLAKFGDRLNSIRNDIKLRQVSAEIKISRKKRKSLIDNFKLDQVVKTIPLALHTLVDIMKNGNERNRLSAAQTLLRPSLAYLEKQGVNVANIEILDSVAASGDLEGLTINFSQKNSD